MNDTEWIVKGTVANGAGEPIIIDLRSTDGCSHARIDWDGSVRLTEDGEHGPEVLTYVGGADELDRLIASLISLRNIAREKFANHNYGEWRTVDGKSAPLRLEL